MRCEWRNITASILRGRKGVAFTLVVAFACALGWARARDPFKRLSFELRREAGVRTAGIVVLPKPVLRHPVIVYLHGSNGTFMKDGPSLRQFAELGFAAVSMDYDQKDPAAFDGELSGLLEWLDEQPWANPESVAWVGSSLGAQRSLSFLMRNPERQPQLYVRLAGGWVPELPDGPIAGPTGASIPFDCPTLLIHGENDRIFPASDCEKLHALLAKSGVSVDMHILPGRPHGFRPDRGAVIRALAEYCADHLKPETRVHAHKVSLHWHYWTPLFALMAFYATRAIRGRASWTKRETPLFLPDNRLCSRIAWGLALMAALLTAANVGLPRMAATDENLRLASRWLARDRIRDDFESLRQLRGWERAAVGDLIEHADLANYREPFLYDNIDKEIWRKFVVSPRIDESPMRRLDWRRPLWENFYPRVRKETDPKAAAKIVVRFLRERVGLRAGSVDLGIAVAWEDQMTGETGWERLYVAALRSATVAARLGSNGKAEIWSGSEWIPAPRPVVSFWHPASA